MKNTASAPHATTQRQAKDSRQNATAGAATPNRTPTTAASTAQRIDDPAKRGEPRSANKPSERSPKQENL